MVCHKQGTHSVPTSAVYTERRYASAVCAVVVCLCVCVFLTHAGTVSKRLNVEVQKHHTIARGY